jgi:hypothetical protein
MATDERTEAIVSAALRRYLGAAVGPDGMWSEAHVPRVVAGPTLEQPRSRRWPLLLAAALTVILIAGAILASGGLNRPSLPILVPTSAPTAEPTASAAESSPPPATIAVDPNPSDRLPPCTSEWSSTGTPPAKGIVDGIRVVDLDGFSGGLSIVFGHPLDTVRRISIAPTQPPFVSSKGETVTVAGNSFLKLTIRGLNKATPSRDDMVSGVPVPKFARTVYAPITEMRRIRTPAYSSAIKAPPMTGSTEEWIIGLEHPTCLHVTTSTALGYGSDEPGANAVVFAFDPVP